MGYGARIRQIFNTRMVCGSFPVNFYEYCSHYQSWIEHLLESYIVWVQDLSLQCAMLSFLKTWIFRVGLGSQQNWDEGTVSPKPPAHTYIASLIINISHQCGTFVNNWWTYIDTLSPEPHFTLRFTLVLHILCVWTKV